MGTEINSLDLLLTLLGSAFNLEERRDLAFALGFDHERLGLEKTSRELILACQRNGKLAELLELCRTKRPNEAWPDLNPSPRQETQPNNQSRSYRQDKIDWRFLVNQIEKDVCTPVISNALIQPVILSGDRLVKQWAELVNYPLNDGEDLTSVAQYKKTMSGHAYVAKDDYLNFLKRCLLDELEGLSGGQSFQSSKYTEKEFARLAHADLTRQIIMRRSDTDEYRVLAMLAQLPLSVFITTSYHTVFEEVLRAQGKEPFTDFYRWSDELVEAYGDNTRLGEGHEPTQKKPLVYHLLGLENDPASLVLTEDDFFDFFERASQDVRRADGFPISIRNTLTKNSLLLLGYDLQSWPFRVVFRGPIKALFRSGRRYLSYAIQLNPSPERGITDTETFQRYVQGFFRDYQFGLYWGQTTDFFRDLQTHQGSMT